MNFRNKATKLKKHIQEQMEKQKYIELARKAMLAAMERTKKK